MTAAARITVPALDLASLVSRPVPIPRLRHVRRVREAPGPPLDVHRAVAEQRGAALEQVRPGQRVAVGVGSRGIARLPEVVTAVLAALRGRGAEVYLVPAMGSHGGATPEGQAAVLNGLGITEEATGSRFETGMGTRVVGEVDGMPVHTALALDDADHVLMINRIKSHTSFSGEVESGLAKMLAIGLGKQRGAEQLHEAGPLALEGRIRAACGVLITELPVLGGVAVVEDERKAVAEIAFLRGGEIGGPREAALLERARALEARLPFDQVDVLVVDLMGKEISGTGMDTNVLGRRMVRGSPEPTSPRITNVVVLAISAASHGNAVGIGLADFVPLAALEDLDLGATYANAFTAGLQGVQRAQVPMVLATDRDATGAALVTAAVPDLARARVARIRSTLALDELMVSASLLEDGDRLEEVVPGQEHDLFDQHGAIRPWPATRPTGTR